MKQSSHFARLRVDACEIGAFEEITIDTSEGEIIDVVSASMRLWDDVFDVQSSERGIVLIKLTVFATILSALPDMSLIAWTHPSRARTC